MLTTPAACRRSLPRRAARATLQLGVAAAAAIAIWAASAGAAAPRYTFVSAPDTWNADIATVQNASGWDPGEPDSINESWRRATDVVLARFASHAPSFVLVAGDLVNGHWYSSAAPYQTLGDASTLPSARRAVREGASIYFTAWKAGFQAHGLAVLPAVGDHELGDNPWTDPMRRALEPVYKAA